MIPKSADVIFSTDTCIQKSYQSNGEKGERLWRETDRERREHKDS